MSLTVVDTPTHVEAADRERYPVQPPAGLARLSWFDDHPVDAAGLLAEMDAAGVHGAVLVQAKGAYGFTTTTPRTRAGSHRSGWSTRRSST